MLKTAYPSSSCPSWSPWPSLQLSHGLLLAAALCTLHNTQHGEWDQVSLDHCWEGVGATTQSHTYVTTTCAIGVRKSEDHGGCWFGRKVLIGLCKPCDPDS